MKNLLNLKTNNILIFICLISILYTLVLLSPVLLTLFATPAGHINMLAGHYFEDYYEYLSFIAQGQRGYMLMQNLFDNFDKSTLFVSWWPYWLIGYITYIFKLPVPATYLYWIGLGLMMTVYFILVYKVIDYLFNKRAFVYKLSAMLVMMVACSFFTITTDKGITVNFFTYWYGIDAPFGRFNAGTPHHQAAHIALLILLILTLKTFGKRFSAKRFVMILMTSLILLSLSPTFTALFWLVFWLSAIIYSFIQKMFPHKREKNSHSLRIADLKQIIIQLTPYMIIMLVTFFAAYLLQKFYVANPTMQSVKKWDLQHLYYPDFKLFLVSTGPILLFVPAGIYLYFKKISFGKLLLFMLSFMSFFLALIPIPDMRHNVLEFLGFHNLRFHTSISYIFLSVAFVEALRIFCRKKTLFIAAIIIFILYSLPVFYIRWEGIQKGIFTAYSLQFIPKGTYEAMKVLEADPRDKAVWTSMRSMLGIVVPSISNKRVYVGRSIFTLYINEKQYKTDQFFKLQMEPERAKKLASDENIGFVLEDKYNMDQKAMEARYPFLKKYFENERAIIYVID